MSRSAETDNARTAESAQVDTTGADTAQSANLESLRAELDRLDDALLDRLVERADVVARIAASARKGPVALRPGREAAIIRRLVGRLSGPLAPQAVVRLWRELLAATTAMQGAHAIAVVDTDPDRSFVQLAREHFGALTPISVHGRPAEALEDIRAGTATVAVLPVPSETDAWWPPLLQAPESRLYVVAQLPFWAPRPEGSPRVEGWVVSAVPPDASGDDRSLLGLELPADITRQGLTSALAAIGLVARRITLRHGLGASTAQALVEIDGLLSEREPRLEGFGLGRGRPILLGAYAVPIGVPE
jgi:chorismate mutase / prephenate dehydratase